MSKTVVVEILDSNLTLSFPVEEIYKLLMCYRARTQAAPHKPVVKKANNVKPAPKKPAIKKPVAKKPVVKKQVVKKPIAKKPVAKKLGHKK